MQSSTLMTKIGSVQIIDLIVLKNVAMFLMLSIALQKVKQTEAT